MFASSVSSARSHRNACRFSFPCSRVTMCISVARNSASAWFSALGKSMADHHRPNLHVAPRVYALFGAMLRCTFTNVLESVSDYTSWN
jgi:hypothetical protein